MRRTFVLSLDVGRRLFYSLGSYQGFLRIEVTATVLRYDETIPEVRGMNNVCYYGGKR